MFKDTPNKVLNHTLFPWIISLQVFVTKLPFLDYRGIWSDEAFTLFHAQMSVKEIWALSVEGEPNPPLFMFIIHFWIKLVGMDASWVRLIPLLFHALTAGLLFKIGKKLSGNLAGLLTSGLFVFSFEQFYFAFEIRTYVLVSLCAAASLYLFILLRSGFKMGYVLLLFLSNLAIIYSHYFGWFVILNQFLFLFFIIKEKRTRLYILASFVFLLICYIPILQAFYKQFLHAQEFNKGSIPYKLQLITEIVYFLNNKRAFISMIAVLLLGVFFKGYYFIKKKESLKYADLETYNILFLFLWFLIPYLIVYMGTFIISMFLQRYILFCTIPFYACLALLIDYLYKNYGSLKWGVAIIVLISMFRNMDTGRKDFYYREVRESVAYAQKNILQGTRIILYPYWAYQEFMYYSDRKAFTDYSHLLQNMIGHSIYPVWHGGMARDDMGKDSSSYSRVLLFMDCGEEDPEMRGIYDYLKQEHTVLDSAFFSQTCYVIVFEKSRY